MTPFTAVSRSSAPTSPVLKPAGQERGSVWLRHAPLQGPTEAKKGGKELSERDLCYLNWFSMDPVPLLCPHSEIADATFAQGQPLDPVAQGKAKSLAAGFLSVCPSRANACEEV